MRSWWRGNFIWAEFGVAVLVAIGATIAYRLVAGHSASDFLQGDRGAVYTVLTSLWGALLGFSITAISIVFVMAADERLTLIRQSPHYQDLWNIFLAAVRALAFATIVSVLALLLDRDAPNRPSPIWFYAVLFSSILATLRVWRIIWVLEKLIRIEAAPSPARKGTESSGN